MKFLKVSQILICIVNAVEHFKELRIAFVRQNWLTLD